MARTATGTAARSDAVRDPKEVERAVRDLMNGPDGGRGESANRAGRAEEALSYLRSVESELSLASVFGTGAAADRKALRSKCRDLRREVEREKRRAECAVEIEIEAGCAPALSDLADRLRGEVSSLEAEVRERREKIVEATEKGNRLDALIRLLERETKPLLRRKRLKLKVTREKLRAAERPCERTREAGTESQLRHLWKAREVLRGNPGLDKEDFDAACEPGARKAIRRLARSVLDESPSKRQKYDGRSRGATPALRALVRDLWSGEIPPQSGTEAVSDRISQ